MAMQPKLLLLDEPFSALDPDMRRQCHDLFQQYIVKSQTATILVTHSPEEAAALGDKTIVFARTGGVIEDVRKTSDPIDMAHLLLAFFIIGALWQAASMVLNKPLLPEPYRVCQTWYALMTTGVLWPHIASSLYRMEVRNYEEMYAAILTLAAIGIIAYMALDIAERKLCPWKK